MRRRNYVKYNEQISQTICQPISFSSDTHLEASPKVVSLGKLSLVPGSASEKWICLMLLIN